ncbi:MAG TPA: diguanylate cyclase [Candidatus Omnitrophota bacterium]|nr:diguanylate cyclase [Candidatus Omnitrophota bacterium]
MLRSLTALICLFLCSYFLTRYSLNFYVYHFLLTPFWVLPLVYWWIKKEKIFFISGIVVFAVWQIYFGFRSGFTYVAILWLLCAAIACILFSVRRVFNARISSRSQEVEDKKRELESIQKKYESRQQSLDHLERQVASLLNLFEIARELSEAADFENLAENLSKSLSRELTFQRVSLWIPLKSKEGEAVKFRVLDIRPSEVITKESETLNEELLAKLEAKRQMVRDDQGWFFPAFDQNHLYAVFSIAGAEEKDLAKIEVLSSFLALLVKKISLYETIRELSIVDDLTGVFVRRHFMDRLREEIKRSQRFKTPLSLLMLDIDHFKRYNDEFGHLVGDATLKRVSEILKMNVRRVDLVGRYGGEEFIVVMPETRQKDALEVAERIRSSIARNLFKIYHVETKVTVSQGIATYDPQNSKLSPEDSAGVVDRLIQASDKCLYQAKEDGRNRVMVSKEWV